MKRMYQRGRTVFGKVRSKSEAMRAPTGLDTVQEAMWNISTFSQQVTALIEDAERCLIDCVRMPQNDDEETAVDQEEASAPSTEELKTAEG